MPVLIATFVDQAVDGLGTRLGVTLVSELTAMSTEAVAKLPFVGRLVRIRFVMMDSQHFEGSAGTSLCRIASLYNRPFELITEISR
jgi:hypothetical protein